MRDQPLSVIGREHSGLDQQVRAGRSSAAVIGEQKSVSEFTKEKTSRD